MIQLIQAASLAANANRQQAERTIINLREQNPLEFVKQVTQVFTNKDVPDNTRQSAGIILGLSFKHQNPNGKYVWDCLEANDKAVLKNMILGVLIDQSKDVRRATANIVASICYIELPRNQWEGIIQKICQNIRHNNPIVKEASILTIGFICQNMKEKTGFSFPPQSQENIMAAILLGLKQKQQVLIETSLKALRDSLSSFYEIMQIQQSREYILKQIVTIIQSGKYLIDGLQILGQYVKSTYESLGMYIQNIYNLLTPILSNTSNYENFDACVAAMQVFENIAEYYRDENQSGKLTNYITGQLGQNLVAQLLKNLLIMENTEQIQDNPVSDSASKTLQSIFQPGSSEYKQLVLSFVRNCMAENNWKYQQGSIKAFSLLLVGLSDGQNQQLISTSLNQLIQLINHDSIHVQYATFESLFIITEICGEIVLKSDNFVQYLMLITSRILQSQNFMHKGSKIIENLSNAEKQVKLGKFNPIADNLIEFFFKIALDNSSSMSIVDWSVETLMNIIEVCYNPDVCVKYLNYVLDNYDNIKSITNSEKRENLYSIFFTIMQYCLHTLYELRIQNIDKNVLTNVYHKVVNHFQAINDVTPDGLYAVEALALYFKDDFSIVDNFFQYILHALNKYQDGALFRAALSCISFFSGSYGERFQTKLPQFFPNMIKLIQEPAFNRDHRLDVIIFLGEIFLNCGASAIPYIDDYMNVVMMCCEAAINLHSTDLQYSERIKDFVIESIQCVIHGISQYPETGPIMSKYVVNIFKFVEMTCNKEQNPKIKYMQQSLTLLLDFVKFYPQLTQGLKGQKFIRQSIGVLNKFNKDQEHQRVIDYARSLNIGT